ncbi:helix-turn-helix domain-containing protein [Pararoseomonas baculiformis]|uniref:helix-turn-helix transcriptional regulator n=1 Tax=Pararoseomonas baculiformis TaxID=2820812 RepID=UPI001ADEC72D|nr:helix-turn-helix transcriptional regulator [Pararoseomonas baculiformis]
MGWDEWALAQRSGRSAQTIKNFEVGRHKPHVGTVQALQSAFARAGLLIAEDGTVSYAAHTTTG